MEQTENQQTVHDAAVLGYRCWPFNSTRLFYTGEEEKKALKNETYQMKGIFSHRHASGFVYNFTEKVHKQTKRCVSAAVIQKKAEKAESTDPSNGNRIETGLLKELKCTECAYRLCCQREDCKCPQLEDDVAYTVLGEEWKSLKDDAAKYAEKLQNVLKKHVPKETNDQSECSPVYVEPCTICLQPTNNRPKEEKYIYFKYNCPWSLVGGIMMPIVVNGTIIAAAIIGQFIWSEAHKEAVKEIHAEAVRGKNTKDVSARESAQFPEDAFNEEATNTIIDILAKDIQNLTESLKNRLARNAAGFFSEVIGNVHDNLSDKLSYTEKQLLKEENYREEAERVIDYLKTALSFEDILCFSPQLLRWNDQERVKPNPYGFSNKSKISIKNISSITRTEAASKSWSINSDPDVFLTRDSINNYDLHLFDDGGEEIWRMSFKFTQPKDRAGIRKKEWETLCYHMETVLRELYMMWELTQREEEHNQYQLTMRQFTHELGQKSGTGKAGLTLLHFQLSELSLQLSTMDLPSDWRREALESCISKLRQTVEDMESTNDGIEYLARLARSKAKGDLHFQPTLYNVQVTTLKNMEHLYRKHLRGRTMRLLERPKVAASPYLYGDEDLVRIAVNNLISNAVKYGYPGTNIFYICYRGYGKDRNGNENRAGVLLDVIDYGIYIPDDPKIRDKIFEDGGRLGEGRNDSMGFGLYLTQEIMKRHGGYCEVAESRIVSAYALPNLHEMIRYAEASKAGLTSADAEKMKEALANAKASGLFTEAVFQSVEASEGPSAPFSPVTVVKEGLRPMAKTTMRLFFPEVRNI